MVLLGPLPTLLALACTGFIFFRHGLVSIPSWTAILLLGTGLAESLMPLMLVTHLLRKANDSALRIQQLQVRPLQFSSAFPRLPRAAHCHEFIHRLPQGYETRVGDIGGRLSGGERQRISIARAILKDAPIVILDEPTAAMDTESEVAVQKAVDALVKERTVFVIAHRLSTIAAADKIMVFDKGRLAEEGTHTGLLEAGGRYKLMWQAQEHIKNWHV